MLTKGGQCKDCWWWDADEEDSDNIEEREYNGESAPCKMLTFGKGQSDCLLPCRSSMASSLLMRFNMNVQVVQKWALVQSWMRSPENGKFEVVTSRFFGCVMFEPRQE